MKKTIRSLCDDDSSSSEEIRPSFNLTAMNSHKIDSKGNTDTIHESKSSDKDSSRILRREFSLSIENDEDTTKLTSEKNSTRKKPSRNRELRSTDTDEEKQLEKSQRYTVSKSNRKAFSSLQNEEADSSSGKEFQTSKIFAKKASKAGKNDELDPSFTQHPEENSMISKKQSLCFKSRVSKIMNKFKEVCNEYELRMEHVKWKHFKKDLIYQESANNILNKSRNVINKLKMELEMQEKELVDFYTEWSKSCVQNTDHEDSSSSEDEELPDKTKKRAPSKSRASSKEGSIVSECDNQEIFSDENTDNKMNGEKDDESESTLIIENSDKSIDDDRNDNATGVTSPILGSKIDKEVPNKTHAKSSSKVVDSSDKVLETSCNKKNEENLNESVNESVNDIFEESIIDTAPTPNAVEPNKDEIIVINDSQLQKDESKFKTVNKETVEKVSPETDGKSSVTDKVVINATPVALKTVESKPAESKTVSIPVESRTVSKPVDSETVSKPVESETVLKPVDIEENEKSDSSNELDDEELAKKALLESDPETPSNDECTTVEKPVRESPKSNSKEEEKSESRKVKSNGNETPSTSTCKDTSSDEQTELTKLENSAKLALLDSNSDDSTDNLTDRKLVDDEQENDSDNSEDLRMKAKLLISSNSETSSDSSSDNELETAKVTVKVASSSEHTKKNKDPLDEASSFTSVGERVKKRRTRASVRSSTSVCSSTSTNNNGSDKKLGMDCRVDLERLPNDVLKKHKKALEMSRHYLECKKIKSLVNVDRLQKDKESSSSSRKHLSKKKLTDKEEKDSLLNYLKELKNGEFVKVKDDNEESNSLPEAPAAVQTNRELMLEADRLTKSLLLNSDSDVEGQKDDLEIVSSEQDTSRDKPSNDRSKKVSPKTEKDSDEEDEEKQKLNKWRRNKILTLKLTSDSDSDARREKFNKNREKLRENADNEDSDVKDVEIIRRRKKRRKIVDSDSDTLILNSDSSSDLSVVLEDESFSDDDDSTKKKKTRKRKTRKSSDTDTSFSEKKPKPKRKRIKNMSTDSDENADDNQVTSSQGSAEKKSRKNIRKVMKDKQVADDTKQAAKEEEERLRRIAERQKLYDEMYETRLANEEKLEKLVLDFDPETKEELVSVHENLVKRLKPHQAKGVKFMWDACFESLEMMKTSRGSGCILAHCMGLGKTLQVIALAHTLLTHDKIDVNTIMVVCPLNTVLNWRNEFHLWLKDVGNDIEVYEMTKSKQLAERRYILESWQRTGGVFIIGYEMFRNLSRTNGKMRKSVKESIMRSLLDPGPDIIVCDEGHLLKNEDTILSKAMSQIRTLRRIILTGTPLQNNLIEYHCMVQFIKPNLLGTKKEFLNRFANPITNGQFDDSTEYDVKLMKKRAYVLHKMLKGCVQRFDYTVLTPFLPPKQEYVIFVSLSEVQINLYRYYLMNFARQRRTRGAGFLFTDFQSLQRIWTHPLVLQLNAEKLERINEKKFSSDSEGSLRNFIDDGSAESSSSSLSRSDEDDEVQAIDCNLPKKNTRQNPIDEITIKPEEAEVKEETWWAQFVQPEHFEDMRISSKLLLLFGILKECEQIGDKILVFSQSLNSLTLIERFLEKIDNETQNGTNSEYLDGHTGSWSLGLDYFRLDGQTSPDNRNTWCKIFNKPSNMRARLFLISTRAGGLGINLTAANRVIIFDASWNPSHDVQSIFRVYRFGQKKPCYVYRFLAAGTMEEKIYNRQVTKLSLSCRVVDVQQIERHYSNNDLSELYKFEPNPNGGKRTLNLPKDRLLAEIFLKYKNHVENYHEHDSLLENKAEEELNEEERKQAWLEYEEEKKGNQLPPATATYFQNNLLLNQHNLSALNASTDYEKLQELIRKDYPNATPAYQQMMTAQVLTDMYTYWEQQTYNAANKIMNQNHMNLPNMRTPGMNMAQTSYGLQNNNPKPTTVDNDIEILPTPTTNKTNKSKEE